VKVILDVGWYRDEVNTDIPNVDLANGQQHVVSVRRHNRGRTVVLKVRYTCYCLDLHSFYLTSFLCGLLFGGDCSVRVAKKEQGISGILPSEAQTANSRGWVHREKGGNSHSPHHQKILGSTVSSPLEPQLLNNFPVL